jgi:pimeloyl-ACP methyl ester carboxylesterase
MLREQMAIDSLKVIQAGDSTQWIRVRGADTANPVLLLIQQGPGLPMINEARRFERLLGLKQAFTVIYWDQRGCGRSLRGPKDRAGVSLERMDHTSQRFVYRSPPQPHTGASFPVDHRHTFRADTISEG